MRRYKLKLTARLLLLLSGMAAFSTALVLAFQDRALAEDLRRAAAVRLDGAAAATDLLVESHLESLEDRFRAISGTPQFRATLEVGDEPTLRFYARQLAAKEGASVVAFVESEGRAMAVAGDAALAAAALANPQARLFEHEGAAYAMAPVPLRTAEQVVGRLVAVAPLDPSLLARWSALCGAEIFFAVPGQATARAVERVVRDLSGLELRAALSLEAEREALANSRTSMLTAGAIAVALAFGASLAVSRGVVRPILDIQTATERIGSGDFSTRIESARSDEIGDVARAFDGMLDRLSAFRTEVEHQRSTLEENLSRLRSSQEQLANAQRLAHIGSWHVDILTGELHGSDEFRSIIGLEASDKPVEPREALSVVHSEDRAALEDALWTSIREGTTARVDCRISLSEHPERILHMQARVRHDAEGRPVLLEGTVQDVTDRKRSEEQIRYLAYHDSLTGLGNRLHCRERLSIQITQARRSDESVGVLFLDLDRFKRINDTLGHSVGDELLQGVADRVVASVRESDFIGRSEITGSISRLGGDEFTILIPALDDVQDLAKVAGRVLSALSKPFDLGDHEVVISGSIGIAAFPLDGEDTESILRNADAAMYHAKEQGRNNYQFYAESMNQVAMRRLILENKLRRGLERGEFELHYQPKVVTATGAVTGAEALVRWRDPETGLVPPADFIPIAEETGLIAPLGDWVLREACARIVTWDRAGHALPISVNLSPHQFRRGGLAKKVLQILELSGAPPSLLELEITESTLMHDEQAVARDLETLRATGVQISVDDFGTGYSSFAYLRKLPVDALKIDRSFLIDVATDKDDAALAASIVAMGKALGLRVVAEGVETEAQRDLLAKWGCDECQGFLFSRPLPAEEFEERFRNPSNS